MFSFHSTERVALLEYEIGGSHSGIAEDSSLVGVTPCRLVRHHDVKYPIKPVPLLNYL
jgi:hypothetical protein